MNKKIYLIISFVLANFILVPAAKAVCPVCTLTVGAFVGLSRWLKIDDTISGIWIGALTVSMFMWTINWLNNKNIRFMGRKIIIFISYYGLIIASLYYIHFMGNPENKIWGYDKLGMGIVWGSIIFYAAEKIYDYLKVKNNNRAYFPWQKVAMPVVGLLIASGIFYFLTK